MLDKQKIQKRYWIAASFFLTVLLSCSARNNDIIFSYIDNNDMRRMREALEQGISPNLFNSQDGKTLLFYAVEKKNKDIVEFLLDNKSDPNLLTKDGKSPLFEAYAKYAGKLSLSLIALLLDRGADANHPENGAPLLFLAVETCNHELTRLLLDHNANPNVIDASGHYPIQTIGGPFECNQKIEKQIEQLLLTHGSKTLESLKGSQ